METKIVPNFTKRRTKTSGTGERVQTVRGIVALFYATIISLNAIVEILACMMMDFVTKNLTNSPAEAVI